MKQWLVFVVTAVLFTIFVFLILLIKSSSFNNSQDFVVSPLPFYLTSKASYRVSTLDLWMPQLNYAFSSFTSLDLSAEAALSYDLTTKRFLYIKNPNKKLPMASLTKIMTAIVSLESYARDKVLLVKPEDLVGENSMGLTDFEKVSMENLLYGLMLVSANDASEVLARNYPFGREGFILEMNNKVKALGLKDTKFSNPSGLMGDGKQYSTVYDLLVITNYALRFSLFREVVQTFSYTILQKTDHKGFYLENETNLLTSYPGVKGVKDGYTPEANLCLVTYLEHGKHKIIAVILSSSDRRGEMKNLLDYSLQQLGETPPPRN